MKRSFLFAATTVSAAAVVVSCAQPSDPTAESPDMAVAAAAALPTLTPQNSGTTNSLIGVSAVNARVVWASGAGGTFTVTTDGGRHWRAGTVPGAEALQFRDVQAFSDKVAYLLSIGNGTDSRIYKTVDGGKTWDQQFRNQNPDAFYDCFAFWSEDRGVAFSDAVDGKFPVRRTTDGGEHWRLIADRLPAAQAGEAAFAASGTCVTAQGGERAWIITGGAAKSRVIATRDGGDTWHSYDQPIVQGTSVSGGFSIDFRNLNNGILVGGDLDNSGANQNVALSGDGGRTWSLGARTPFPGAAFGVSYVGGSLATSVVATGPGGAAYSHNEGRNGWNRLPDEVNGYWDVTFARPKSGWFVGTGGRILKISF
jgi:photosystem II stability/assembly factor-like uncharacterized protein